MHLTKLEKLAFDELNQRKIIFDEESFYPEYEGCDRPCVGNWMILYMTLNRLIKKGYAYKICEKHHHKSRPLWNAWISIDIPISKIETIFGDNYGVTRLYNSLMKKTINENMKKKLSDYFYPIRGFMLKNE